MLTIYSCITTQHDLRLVLLAAFVCLLASFAAINLLHHAANSTPKMRHNWLAVAAVATGFGIWATHFIAMLAFQPAVPSGYNVALTVLSLVAAVTLTGVGLSFAVTARSRHRCYIGGAVVGGGIAVMHYSGMAAFEFAGRIIWDVPLVVASIALGAGFGAVALALALRASAIKWKVIGAALLTVAICSHHFTAMAAAVIVPDLGVSVSELALPAGWMAVGIAVVSIGIIVLAAVGLALDLRDRRTAGEAARMRELANAAVEGLIVCDNAQIVAANQSFTSLACPDGSQAVGRSLEAFIATFTLDKLSSTIQTPLEAMLRVADGSSVPVELIRHDIIYSGKPHQVLAVRDIRERKKAEEEIYFLAHHDPLTALPNRTSFNRKLEDELAAHRGTDNCVAVLLLDLDRFKEINDLFGHLTGDAVLQFVAGKIQGVLRPGQMVARLGGDEFALIAPGLPRPDHAAHTAAAILAALDGDGEGLPSGAAVATSIGIAIFPNDAADGKTLLNYADAALYEAKSDGRGLFRFFEPSMGACLRNRRQLEHDIRHAIARDELNVVFQPQSDLQSGQIFGFEALLRWNHATRGRIPPAEFIPIAEECGAILQIGEWILRTACAEAVRWERPLAIAVNVSVVQLHSGKLPELVDRILQETGLEPSRLELEITESTLVKDVGRALEALCKLKALGVRIAMDDFGTGYSSLTNLRAFPFDKIKVDQSFIRSVHTNDETAAIMRAVFGLARGLGLPVLAEGVETEGELSFLRQEGCDAMQGYFLAHPAPINEFERYTSQPGKAASRTAQTPSGRMRLQISPIDGNLRIQEGMLTP